MVENPLADAGDISDVCLIPGLGWSPGEGNTEMEAHSNILAWRIPRIEERGGL